jgi:hypothetical protein
VSVLELLLEPVTRQVREAVGAGVSRHEPSRVSHARSNTLLVYLLPERRSPSDWIMWRGRESRCCLVYWWITERGTGSDSLA